MRGVARGQRTFSATRDLRERLDPGHRLDQAANERKLLMFGEHGGENTEDRSFFRDDWNITVDQMQMELDTAKSQKMAFRVGKLSIAKSESDLISNRPRGSSMGKISTEFLDNSLTSPWVISVKSIRKAWWDTLTDVLVLFSVITSLYFLGF